MPFCLTKEAKQKFKQGLKSGKINPNNLSSMTSEERRTFLSGYVGEENAKQTNALFESKLLLKNQKAGYIAWAKKISGISPTVRQDLISRIEKMDKILNPSEEGQFLEDLVSTRLKINVTQEEAKNISELSTKVASLKEKSNQDGVFSNQEDRLLYGVNKVALEKYINDLKLDSRRIFFKEQPVKKIMSAVGEVPGALKSSIASLDNSFWGRQGIKTLLDFRTSKIWVKNFLKSWKDIGKQLTAKGKWYTSGEDVALDAIKADIYSRPNALNGKYDAGRYGLSVLSEEAYPSSLPEKIPLLGRLFKASEAAYNGGALRMRADLADRLITLAEKNGVNTLDKAQAQGIGNLVNSLTGRGNLGKAEALSKEINVLMFSIKFLKSNFDTLLAPAKYVGQKVGVLPAPTNKGEAAKSTLRMMATLAVVLTLSKLIDPDSVDEDPRSSNFGKVKIFGHWRDITGGMGGLMRLASYMVPTYHNGKWSHWKKTSTGKWVDMSSGEYGSQDAFDTLIEGLFTNKLSPVAGLFRDGLKGEFFGGEPFTLAGAIKKYTTPLSIQNYQEMLKDPGSSFILGDIILEGLGLSSSVYIAKTDWEKSTSQELTQFRAQVGDVKFKVANEEYNQLYNWWYVKASKTDSFKKLSEEGKSSLISKAKEDLKEEIFRKYEFKYKSTTKKKNETEEKYIQDLLP